MNDDAQNDAAGEEDEWVFVAWGRVWGGGGGESDMACARVGMPGDGGVMAMAGGARVYTETLGVHTKVV